MRVRGELMNLEETSTSDEGCYFKTNGRNMLRVFLSSFLVQLSDTIFLFTKKKISEHGNVFQGELRSGVYGARSCAIKFGDISEHNMREANILNKLGYHTNVITIIQSGTYSDILEDRFYIALDICHE